MTLEEAIKHCEEQVQKQIESNCLGCAEDHYQLLQWLIELKELKKIKEELLNDIDIAIKACNMMDEYSIGMRNGMRLVKGFVDNKRPKYEKVSDVVQRTFVFNCDTGCLEPCRGTWEWEWADASNPASRERCYCSNCGKRYPVEFSDQIVQFDYCPNCGIRMKD